MIVDTEVLEEQTYVTPGGVPGRRPGAGSGGGRGRDMDPRSNLGTPPPSLKDCPRTPGVMEGRVIV